VNLYIGAVWDKVEPKLSEPLIGIGKENMPPAPESDDPDHWKIYTEELAEKILSSQKTGVKQLQVMPTRHGTPSSSHCRNIKAANFPV
jgi:hypothetical protein